MRAWVDESIRVDRAPAPMYLLGASIIETEAEADIVSALRSRAPRAGKLHLSRPLHSVRTFCESSVSI